MLTRCLSLLLAATLVCSLGTVSVFAADGAGKEAARAEKVRRAVLKLGVGPDARVQVKLRDKTTLAGYVSEAGPDSFVVTDAGTGVATVVPYPQVKSAKGHNLSTGAKIAIGVGIAAAVVLVVYLIIRAKCGPEGRCLDN